MRSRSSTTQVPDEANPVAAIAVIAGGNRDAVDLFIAGLQPETHPLVERDRAAVHRGRNLVDDRDHKWVVGRAELADLALFLCSDAAAYITAQTLNVDGGNVMS